MYEVHGNVGMKNRRNFITLALATYHSTKATKFAKLLLRWQIKQRALLQHHYTRQHLHVAQPYAPSRDRLRHPTLLFSNLKDFPSGLNIPKSIILSRMHTHAISKACSTK